MELTHGSLFAGIGGFDLGFERAGIKTIWQVEIDDYCRRVLARHFPEAQRFADIRNCCGYHFHSLSNGHFCACGRPNYLDPVDIISGGFPCQDISNAGKRAGIDGERSGLWSEYARIIRELRPRYVVVENVAALLGRGMERVLGDLAACGYDAEWDCIPASAVGAPHRRDRLWIVAYPKERGQRTNGRTSRDTGHSDSRRKDMAYASCECGIEHKAEREGREVSGGRSKEMADPNCGRREQCDTDQRGLSKLGSRGIQKLIFAGLEGYECGVMALAHYRRSNSDPAGSGWWSVEPAMGRLAHGVSGRVAPLRALGNSLVPQIAEWIGRRLIDAA